MQDLTYTTKRLQSRIAEVRRLSATHIYIYKPMSLSLWSWPWSWPSTLFPKSRLWTQTLANICLQWSRLVNSQVWTTAWGCHQSPQMECCWRVLYNVAKLNQYLVIHYSFLTHHLMLQGVIVLYSVHGIKFNSSIDMSLKGIDWQQLEYRRSNGMQV